MLPLLANMANLDSNLKRRSVLLSLPLVFLLYAIAAFITGITLYAFRGLKTTASGRHFEDFTHWAVVGAVGALACILLTSQTLIH
jgi:low temperature requirement protein LtrA